MRVLLVAFPLRAHFYDLVPLARALRSAGHEVDVVSQSGMTDDDVAELIRSAGLPATALGDPADLAPLTAARRAGRMPELAPDALAVDETAAAGDTTGWRWNRHCMATQFGMTYPLDGLPAGHRPYVDHLVDHARAFRPDLVVWDTLCFPAAIAAREVGAAHARFLWGRDHVGWVRERSRQEQRQAARRGAPPEADPLTAWLEPLLERYGHTFEEEFLLGQWSIDLTPSPMALPVDHPRVPVRRLPYNGAGALPAWLREAPERPRVCLSLGTTARLRPHRGAADGGVALADLLAGLGGLDAEIVATLSPDQLAAAGGLPDNVRPVDYVPLDLLLPTCSAIVHHGGAGTFAAAAAHRVPQVVVPVPRWDEPALARYVAGRGAGLALGAEDLTPATLRQALTRLLGDDAFRAGAAALHEELRSVPGPRDTVPVLEALTERHRTGSRRPHGGGRTAA
ncbi:nucleotide disphospho-sugar-binding domain-containing protein [Streptomyces brasiliscabiei]|uniref:nucleotide disphospho-sugar-binding domain-containing protein n=1 Tax=Streptomyces brasiliscabiei TaxID=2736302 RepID=UPI001C10328F|nr:nucleotide disphospho-sugar-binding domain-containing protein [Streptomyces brasiliscabiei]